MVSTLLYHKEWEESRTKANYPVVYDLKDEEIQNRIDELAQSLEASLLQCKMNMDKFKVVRGFRSDERCLIFCQYGTAFVWLSAACWKALQLKGQAHWVIDVKPLNLRWRYNFKMVLSSRKQLTCCDMIEFYNAARLLSTRRRCNPWIGCCSW